jgi:HD superfamily phosphohydrolase
MMRYLDPVYGSCESMEPVLLDVMESAAMQRLRGVLQHGISGLIGITKPTTRFEHSVGAMLLVRRLGAAVPEQIAALLHDVSHTAFSHVMDYVYGGHDSQSYHEEVMEEYVAGSDVPAALARHGYDWRNFLHEGSYPLLEQPAPALCADRLDYFLRDSLDLGLMNAADVARILEHLVVYDGRIVTDDVTAARQLAYTYMAADKGSWANFREVGLYELAATAIKRGLEVGAITQADIWGTDEAAWGKLQAYPDAELQAALRLVHPETQFIWDEEEPTFRVSTKLRTIDPGVLQDGVVRPLSELDGHFGRMRADYLAESGGKWPMRVVRPAT